MNIWIALQIVLNVLLVSIVFYFLLRLKREDKSLKERATQIEEWTELKNTLETSVQEALRVSNRIQKDIQSKQQAASQITQVVEKEKKALLSLLEEIKSKNSFSNSSSVNERFQEPWLNDKYSKAVQLSSQGFSPQEIAKKINLPIGEVELVLSLRK